MKNSEIGKAIAYLKPDSQYAISGDDYANLVWLDENNEPPTLKEITDTIKLLPSIEAAKAKELAEARNRLLEKLGITEDEAKLLLS